MTEPYFNFLDTVYRYLASGDMYIHLKDFWWQYKHDGGYVFETNDEGIRNIYALVIEQFKTPFALVSYLIGIIALFFHLKHGFQSAFQTLGLEHKKYTPFIKAVGLIYSIIVPIGFASMPIYVFFIMDIQVALTTVFDMMRKNLGTGRGPRDLPE